MASGDTWPRLEQLGRITLRLHIDTDWIKRRVETVRLVDTSQVERTVTLDVDLDRLRRIVDESRGMNAKPRPTRDLSVLAPLTLLPKNLLFDLDVRDGAGHSVPIVVSDEDSTAAQAALLVRLKDIGQPVETFPQSIADNLFRITRAQPAQSDVEAIKRTSGNRHVKTWGISGVPPDVRAQWYRLFDLAEFKELLSTYTVNYMPMVRIDLGSGAAVIKYRHMERQQSAMTADIMTRLSLDAYPQLIQAPSIGSGGREHLRFVAPEGLFIEEFYLSAVDAPAVDPGVQPPDDTQDVIESETPVYLSRVSPERSVIYTALRGRVSTQFEARASLRPKVKGFLRAAQYTVLFTTLLLGIGTAAQLLGRRLSNGNTSTEAAVALLLVIPSTMSAFLAGGGEHDLLSELLRLPRFAVATSAAAAVGAAGAMVIRISDWRLGLVWGSATVIGTAVWLLLSRICRVSNRAFRETSGLADRTFEEDLP